MDPSLGHGQHPRQRGHDDRHEGEVPSRRTVLPPATKHVPGLDNWVASNACPQRCPLHSRDELFAKHTEPEPALDWAMEEVSDDDAPLPDAPPEPQLPCLCLSPMHLPLSPLTCRCRDLFLSELWSIPLLSQAPGGACIAQAAWPSGQTKDLVSSAWRLHVQLITSTVMVGWSLDDAKVHCNASLPFVLPTVAAFGCFSHQGRAAIVWRIILLHGVRISFPSWKPSPNRVPIELSQIAFPIIVLPKDDHTDSAQEERLDLPYWTMILAICVVVDESKCLDIPIWEFSIIWSILHFYLSVSRYCVCCLSIATWQSGYDIHDLCCRDL